MVTVKHTLVAGVTKVIVKQVNGVIKASCACCCDEWLVVDFPNSDVIGGIGASGSICADGFGFQYGCWCEGGTYDHPLDSGRQHILTNVGLARCDGVWTSSVNFAVKAHRETYCDGMYVEGTAICDPQTSTSATLSVTYKGVTKTASMDLLHAELESNCTGFDVGLTITVYAAALGDGSYFEIT